MTLAEVLLTDLYSKSNAQSQIIERLLESGTARFNRQSERTIQMITCFHRIRYSMALSLAMSAVAAFGQVPADTTVTQKKPEPQTQEAKGVRDRATEWLSTKGWKVGRNKDGSYVAFAVAPYDVKSKQWAVARSNAFQAGLLDAKRKLAESLAADVSTEVAAAIQQGAAPVNVDGRPKDIVDSMLDLAKKEKVDAAEMGTETSFGRAVRVLARAEVVGSQVVKIFDHRDANGHGAMATVVRWNPLGTDVVERMLGRRKERVNAPDVSQVNALDSMSVSDLDSLFGARIMKEADGESCVVAFGQADVLGQTEAAVGAAEKKAGIDALGNLRQFVGELVACEQILERRSSIKDIVDLETDFKNDEAFRELCKATAKGLQLQGVEEYKTWSGQTEGKFQTFGVVKKWSITNADWANELRQKFNELRPSIGGPGRGPVPSPVDPKPVPRPLSPAPPIDTRPESPDLK